MQEKLVNITRDENLPDVPVEITQKQEQEKAEASFHQEKLKLVNVDKNEAYKNFIEQDGLEESQSILNNIVIV